MSWYWVELEEHHKVLVVCAKQHGFPIAPEAIVLAESQIIPVMYVVYVIGNVITV